VREKPINNSTQRNKYYGWSVTSKKAVLSLCRMFVYLLKKFFGDREYHAGGSKRILTKEGDVI